MFGNASDPSRIYSYGAKRPTANADLVSDQLWRANRYRNDLCASERQRRAECEAVLRERCPEVVDLEHAVAEQDAVVVALVQAVKDRKRDDRRKQTREESASIREARAALKDLRARHKAARLAAYADPALTEALDAVNAAAVARGKSLRANSTLYWGTYLAVEQGCQSFRKGPPPQFKAYHGEGKIAVQLQGGLSLADALSGADKRFRLVLHDLPTEQRYSKKGVPLPMPDPRSKRSAGRQDAEAWLRIGTEEGGREPVWAVVPVQLHRMPPAGCQIKWVYLVRRMVATHEEWRLQLVVSREEGFPREDQADSGTVGIDAGWRLLPTGEIRVAVWSGSDGGEGELRLPAADVSRWAHADSLRSIRDKNFDTAKGILASWMAAGERPAWLVEATATLRQWRSQRRLARLALAWRQARFDGDAEMYDVVEAWRKQDRHLYDWQEAERTKAARWRDQTYRTWAAQLRRRYKTAVVEDADWRQLARRPDVGSDETINETARYNQRIASVGRLREVLRESMARLVEAESKDTTRKCHACGDVHDFDRDEILHTCTACGAEWDQDVNAARNLLASGGGADGIAGPARGPEAPTGRDVTREAV